jgi:hypothetical protein
MYSSRTCALSGAFIIVGGWAGVMWVFMRALALHLQICWQVIIGKQFMYGALLGGWGIPFIAMTLALIFSGVSFRFGDTCHINHKNSLADFWIPLLIFSGLTVIIQFATLIYCIKVYLASLADNSSTTNSSTNGLPSYTNSIRTVSPKQAYRRVRRVIELQWRGIAIVLLIIADVIFFSIVFVFVDNTEQSITTNKSKALPWLSCLVDAAGDKTKCFDFANDLVVNESTVMAVLILLSVSCIDHLFPGVSNMYSSTASGYSSFSGAFLCSQAGMIWPVAVSVRPRNSFPQTQGNSAKTHAPMKCSLPLAKISRLQTRS